MKCTHTHGLPFPDTVTIPVSLEKLPGHLNVTLSHILGSPTSGLPQLLSYHRGCELFLHSQPGGKKQRRAEGGSCCLPGLSEPQVALALWEGGGADREGMGGVIWGLAVGPGIGVCAWNRFSIVLVMLQSLGIANLALPK